MAFCADQIVLLAGNTYSGLNSPPSQSVGLISGWLTNSGNIGDLNNKLSTSFYLSGDCLVPDFGGEEADIYQQVYNVTFYESQSLNVLANAGTFWTSITEGDTKFNRSDMVSVSKQYLALQQSAQSTLRLAIHDYKLRITVPVSIDAAPLSSFPTP